MTNEKGNGNGLLEVVFILDRSGSMSGKEADTIGGFNSMLEKQKAESDNIIWSTMLFDDEEEYIHRRVPIQNVKPISEEEYFTRGCTALLDAVGHAIEDVTVAHTREGDEAPDKVLFIITTDGYENASREYNYSQIKRLIEEKQNEYGWEFLFLGAGIDAVEEAGRIGIRRSRAARYKNDRLGIRQSYVIFNDAVCKMAQSAPLEDDILDELREEELDVFDDPDERGCIDDQMH